MTGEIANRGITVLPCRVGNVTMPPTLVDKLYLSVEPTDLPEAAIRLAHAMKQHLAPAQPLPPRQRSAATSTQSNPTTRYSPQIDVRMTGIDTNSMTSPRNDGTPGSALYRVPITLSVTPDHLWSELFGLFTIRGVAAV